MPAFSKQLKYLVPVLAIAGLIAVAGIRGGRQNAPEPAPAASDEPIVRMTAEGFVPQTLTVAKGTTVIFRNEDSVSRWPASGFHPTHSLYPEFDPRMPIQPGEEWQFTFDKVGTWPMHDHLMPSLTGQIVVTE